MKINYKALLSMGILILTCASFAQADDPKKDSTESAQNTPADPQPTDDASREPAGAGVGVTSETLDLVKEVGNNLQKNLDRASRPSRKIKNK